MEEVKEEKGAGEQGGLELEELPEESPESYLNAEELEQLNQIITGSEEVNNE